MLHEKSAKLVTKEGGLKSTAYLPTHENFQNLTLILMVWVPFVFDYDDINVIIAVFGD